MWRELAECRGKPVDWWFHEQSSTDTELAQRICGRCVVRVDCQQHAMAERIDYGIWGGLTADERKSVRRKKAKR